MAHRTTYNKLVRDRIPDIIRAEGRECSIEILSDEDYVQALRTKLIEEAQEVAEAEGDDLMKELADLMEVMDALMKAENIQKQDISTRQQSRAEERGRFDNKIQLVWTE